MKICILSIGRAGSTSLYNAIKNHLTKDYYCISEPFNHSYNRINKIDENQFDVITSKENVLIKTIINHRPDDKDENFINEWIFKFFDKVILLDRLDIKLQIESFSYLIHTKSKSWHKKQFFDMSLISPDAIKEWEVYIRNHKKTMNDLCVKYNKKIYYYEDIFLIKNPIVIDEIFEYLEIIKNPNIVEKYILSDEHKVRMDKKNNKLI
jgi:hypothetical protein